LKGVISIMKNILILFSLLLTTQSFGATTSLKDCQNMFPNNKIPVVNQSGLRELCFSEFAVLYSSQSKAPVYSVQKLDSTRLDVKVKRNNKFHEESLIPKSERATLNDFKKSGYDKGHCSEAAAMSTDLAAYESVSLSNVIFQSPAFNRGTWAKSVELPTRKYVKRNPGHKVVVFTGPYFESNHLVHGNNVWVASYMWKLVYDETTNRSWVYFLENKNDVRMTKPITYQEFVAKTGLHLLD
jgi:endonuclease G